MASVLQLPAELWLHVFKFLSWRDRLSMRLTCSHFRGLLDKSSSLWREFSLVLRDFSRYNRQFWHSLAQRHISSVSVRSGRRKQLRQLFTWLPALHALRLDEWTEGGVTELKLFHRLQRLSITSCSTPLKNLDFLLPLSHQLTKLCVCNVQLTCPPSYLSSTISQLTCLTSLVLHHNGNLRVPTLGGILTHLTELKHLSWSMITYKTLSHDFFSPAHLSGKQVTLIGCHPQAVSVCPIGGHALAVFAGFLPSSLLSLTLCVDLQPEDLQVVSRRAPHLEQLHLEPWICYLTNCWFP
uniref:F-box domain-containing protein n=1 Tax=Echeneis naucrates TaxID=173247 RepID=A0A665UNG1_ECHNA